VASRPAVVNRSPAATESPPRFGTVGLAYTVTPEGHMLPDPLQPLLRRPVMVAPMAGGPGTPVLVAAAADAGALGFLAAGYLTAGEMRAGIDSVHAATGGPFGVNLFVPGQPAADPAATARYVNSLRGDADRLGAVLGEPAWDDDVWAAKLDVLLADPPPVVSFTFGCPDPGVLSAFRHAGSVTVVTVTSPAEAGQAVTAGAACLCVQGAEAGAHQGTFGNYGPSAGRTAVLPLIAEVARITDVPLIAAGGIMTAAGTAAALAAGAAAVQCGTAFLRCPESGAHPVHKATLASGRFTGTTLTRAFSGRPARGLVNQFIRDHPDAPAAYPEINNATRPLRAAAARQGDADRMSLWAGTGYRHATDRPAAEVIDLLDPGTG
jgi:nitronate monooxygenase